MILLLGSVRPPGLALHTPFGSGVVGIDLDTPFENLYPPVGTELSTPFDILNDIGIDLDSPFHLLGPLGFDLDTPFDLITSLPRPRWGNVYPPAPVNAVLDGPVLAGATTVTLDSTAGITPGTVLLFNAPESAVVESVDSGTDVTLATPLAFGHADGSSVLAPSGFSPTMMVFTKGGEPIGVIGVTAPYSISGPPTQAILTSNTGSNAQGQMVFHVPRTLKDGQTVNPEASLISDDRLVAVASEVGGPLWAGSIEPQASSGGVVEATCFDLFAQFNNTTEFTFELDIPDATPAWSVIAVILDAINARRAGLGELQWNLEHTGTKPFRGSRYEYKGDIIGAIEEVVENADIEVMWRATVDTNLIATLVVSDRFATVSAFSIHDGPGSNIMARPQILRDPSRLIHSLHLTGTPTDLAECLPEYAHWAITNATPEVTVTVDPGANRERGRVNVAVPWGYSQATITQMCDATLDEVWALYYSFLRAIHDMEGRPFHEGYEFNNESQDFTDTHPGHRALSRITWRTRLQLVETYPDTPASAVMISDARCQINRTIWWLVMYNRQTGVKTINQWPLGDVSGAGITIANLATGLTTAIYRASGTRIVERDSIAGPWGFFVESYNTRLWDPVHQIYRNLRRLISGNHTGWFVNPADPDLVLTALPPGSGVDNDTLSELIGKVYDFEAYNIVKWDPFRDGVGVYKSARTIFDGGVTTRERWHVTSYNAGAAASTSLIYGVSATEQDWLVDSDLGWPTPESADFPFEVEIDEGLAREVVLVDGMDGLEWHVIRGQQGTTAIIHEPGAAIHRLGGEEFDGLTPLPTAWPEGQAFAEELAAKLSLGATTLRLLVANIDDAWRECDFGSIMPINISTEGAGEGFVGTARVIGRSPDPFGAGGPPGSMEIIFDEVTPA